ncbi:MAG: MotA/TolQ/ExbB proton channel family protein [Saprospiraceae bacterium]|nr:MotA/TolQ/ExbB proton channel family protein [Saprospiraceae bacterium]
MFQAKSIKVIFSVLGAICAWLFLLLLGYMSPEGSGFKRLVEVLGGTSSGYIQAIMYALFAYSILELIEKRKNIQKEYQGFNFGLLPTQDQLVLSPEEVAKIKLTTIQMEKNGQQYLVNDFIKKACTQYRNDESIGETLQVFNAQVDTTKEEMEGGLEIVRYLQGAIISLGFVGTLIGLSTSIGMAHLAKTVEGMPQITKNLNVAFDTTLVALLIGLVLNFFYHRYLKEMDTFYSKAKAYVINNLISRIYKPAM